MRPLHATLVAVLAAAAAASPAALRAQAVVSTLPAWNGRDLLGSFGLPFGSSSVGQTFTAPDAGTAGAALTGFSLFLSADHVSSNPGGLLFRGYLMAWDGTRAAGPFLYQSAVRAGHAVQDDPMRYDFDFAPVGLAPGASYVFFLSRLGLADAMGPEPDASNDYGFVRRDAYAGGRLVYFDVPDGAADDVALVGQGAWGQRPELDLAFEARFGAPATVAPEPASLALVGAGAAALGLVARRRRTA